WTIACAAFLFAACRDCKEGQARSAYLCLPDAGVAGASLTLSAAEGCASCDFNGLSCSVVRIDGGVAVSLNESTCSHSGSCAANCARHDVACPVPPLEEGDYGVTLNGVPGPTLHVRPQGGSGCALPAILPPSPWPSP